MQSVASCLFCSPWSKRTSALDNLGLFIPPYREQAPVHSYPARIRSIVVIRPLLHEVCIANVILLQHCNCKRTRDSMCSVMCFAVPAYYASQSLLMQELVYAELQQVCSLVTDQHKQAV